MTHYDLSYLPPRTRQSMPIDASERHSARRLTATEYRNCHVLTRRLVPGDWHITGGVVTAEGEYVEGSGFHEIVGAAYPFRHEAAAAHTRPAIYLGVLHDCWGHVIADGIKRLWFLHTPEGKTLLREGADVVYATLSGKPLPEYALDVLKLGGYATASYTTHYTLQ